MHTYTKIRSKIYIGAARKTQCDASIASVLSHSLELWGFLVLNLEDLLISAHIENKSNSQCGIHLYTNGMFSQRHVVYKISELSIMLFREVRIQLTEYLPYQVRGGGGSEARMTKFTAAIQKPLTL